jgi:hypothetical protein
MDHGHAHHDPPRAQHGDAHRHGVVDPAIISTDRGLGATRGICDGADYDAVAYLTTSGAAATAPVLRGDLPQIPPLVGPAPRAGGRHSP